MRIRTLFASRRRRYARASETLDTPEASETPPPPKRDGLLHAVLLDGKGGLVPWPRTGKTRTTNWADVDDWETWEKKPALWLHLDAYHKEDDPPPYTHRWLFEKLENTNSRDAAQMLEHLKDPDAEPKFRETGQGFILVLRGVNYTMPPLRQEDYKDIFSEELEDRYELIPLNCWLQPASRRLITVRPGDSALNAIDAYIDECERGRGSDSLGFLLAELAMSVSKDITRVIKDLTGRIGELEKDPFTQDVAFPLDELASIRRQAIVLEAHMTPQHLALSSILNDSTATVKFKRASNRIPKPFDSEVHHRDEDREERDDPEDVLKDSIRVTKEYEDFASNVRERAAGVQSSITSIATARFSRQSIILSAVATMTLPLTLVTAIVSVNVGGMFEGRGGTWFWLFLVILLFLGGVVWRVFRYFYRLTNITVDNVETSKRKRRKNGNLQEIIEKRERQANGD